MEMILKAIISKKMYYKIMDGFLRVIDSYLRNAK